ncbi:MAG: GatB/YqeY domain-containing protein [Catenulispora sp.]|nr:GatB/YqeY domain-containing protein [Catenulispora sp.]
MHSEPLRDRLRAALTVALKNRDRTQASTIRAVLSAIDNAEAVEAGAGVRAGAVEASPVGAGAAEVARRELSEADVVEIVRREIEEQRRAAAVFEKSGRGDRAGELRAAAEMVSRFLE